MQSHQSGLLQKREIYRKQIRREQLQQKFMKIRVSLYEQFQSSSESQQMRKKVLQTIQLIEERSQCFIQIDGNVQNGIQLSLRYLLNLSEDQLREPDLEIRKMLQNESIIKKISERWQTIYKWEEEYGQTVENIIKAISNSFSSHSYKQQIITFLLRTIEFLLYANKIRHLRKLATKQPQRKYLVGEPQKYFRSILRKQCQNILMNLTATDDQNLILPFLCPISKLIRQASDFALIYHNVFLTSDIPLGQKLQMFKDFLDFLERNPNSIRDHDSQYIRILYVAYGNPPYIIKVKFNSELISLQLNYRCLNIIEACLGALSFKIEQFYALDPHKEEYGTIIEIALILECIFKEEEHLLSKVPQKPNVLKFLVNRLKHFSTVPEIRCVHNVLRGLSHLSSYADIFGQVEAHYSILSLELYRTFDKLFMDLFVNEDTNQQNNNRFRSQLGKLELQCVRQLAKILRLISRVVQNCLKYLKTGLIGKLLVVCSFWTDNRGSKSLRLIKDECLEILCQTVMGLVRMGFRQEESQCLFEHVDVLIGEFFYAQNPQKKNLFQLISIELNQMMTNDGSSSSIIFSILVAMLNELLPRIYSQIQGDLYDTAINEDTYHLNKLLDRSKWFMIYKEYRLKNPIFKHLQHLLYSSKIKIVTHNQKMQRQIADLLELTDKIDKLCGIKQENNSIIELEK